MYEIHSTNFKEKDIEYNLRPAKFRKDFNMALAYARTHAKLKRESTFITQFGLTMVKVTPLESTAK